MSESIVLPLLLSSPFVGSFIACAADRWGSDRSPFTGRSACETCGEQLRWFEIIPMASFLLLRGRCRSCGADIPRHLLWAELFSILLTAMACLVAPSDWLLPTCLLGWALLCLALMDIRHLRLANIITIPLLLGGLLCIGITKPDAFTWHLAGAVVGGIGLWLIRTVYWYVRARHGLGLGDVKLMAAAGAWLGLAALPSVLMIASCAGIGAVMLSKLGGQAIEMNTRFAFGPYLAIAIWITWLYGPLQLGSL